MKVLQILPSLEVGGVERGVVDLARAMKRRGHESVVVSSGGELVAELQKMGIPHYELPVHRKSIFTLGLIGKLTQIIHREGIDLLHARSRVPAWLAWFASRRTGIPMVTTCHGYYSVHPLSRVMGWGKRVIVISRVIGRHMVDDFGVPPERIRLIHRGVDLSQFPWRGRPTQNRRPFRIINVGRFSPIKGQIEFLKSVYLLKRDFPHLEVWLVGSEGKEKGRYTRLIEQTIRQWNLESCVKLLGTRRDVPSLIADSDLLVLSTLVPEAFGRVVIEAGAVGTPVLSTKVGGVIDILEDGQNGLFVSPADPPAMAKAMARIIRDPAAAREMAVRLRQKVESEFSLDQMADKTLAVYEEARKKPKILVIKLGAMGDVILAVPSLRMLRSRFPSAHLALLVDRALAPLVSRAPYLNEIIPIDRSRLSRTLYLLKIAKRLRRENFEISVDLQNSKWTHLLAALSGVRERYGFGRGRFGFLLNRPDPSFSVSEPPVRHQFRLLSKLGVHELEEALELWPDREAEEKIEGWFGIGAASRPKKRVGFILGASLKWPTKRWPLAYFERLSERLRRELDCEVVLIGSPREIQQTDSLSKPEDASVVDLVGKTSLEDLVALIGKMDLIVTGDTAPLHIASALGTKAVALFGPTDPKRHAPPGNGIVVLSRNLPCQPCYEGTCRNPDTLACLKQITPDEVFEAVRGELVGSRV